MSVNTSHTQDGAGVLLYQGEFVLLFSPHVVMEFEANPSPIFPSKKLTGYIYLTSHRVIYINNKGGAPLVSFAMPFFCMRNVKLEQPLFGANYMKGTAIAQPGGNYQGDVLWKMTFPKGGCIDFGQALLRANDTVQRFAQFTAPPPYVPPTANYHSAPAASYYQGNNPAFPDVPSNVYVYEQPPPYYGIYDGNAAAHAYQNVPGNVPPYPANAPGVPPYPNAATNAPPYPNSNNDGVRNRGNPASSAPPYEPPPAYEAPPLPHKA
uniref:GRAM domain-containing protein n=1 Tax=Panagrellus redivivus TaxID=6233 RepID=A0A7E4UVB1_PANRE